MPENRLMTLLSDFGGRDVYVGVMKGVIAQINSAIRLVDLTHEIPPQDVMAARFCLMEAFPYFPDGTVHLAVVDPGVGGSRRAIAVELATGFLVGPDNGLLTGVLRQYPALAAIELTNRQYWRSHNPSSTFHGRDIFAPVAAHLASGVPLAELGQEIDLDSLVTLPIPECIPTEKGVLGCIQYVDYFGNLVTNVPGSLVAGKVWSVQVGEMRITGQNTYSDISVGSLVGLVGSHGWVEIAINGGNAQSQLQVKVGTQVQISFSAW